LKRIQIHVEVKIELMKWIELPDDEAAELMEASEADIVCNLDIMSDYHDQGEMELIDIVEVSI